MLEIIQYGLSVALVGIGTVFAGLVILICLIKLMNAVINGASKEKKADSATDNVIAATVAEPEIAEEADNGELIAVIAAAVAAAMEAAGEENTTGFVVRSIRRINNAPVWNRAGREEQVYSRM